MAPDLLLVGHIARAHGNRGHVIVNLESDFAEDRFKVGRILQVGASNATVARRIASVRFHQGRPIVRFDGVETISDAEALAGADLWLPESDLVPLPDGTFHRHALVGCQVRDTADAIVGRVTAVEGPMERSHLVVQGDRGEVLIPLAADICVRVDPTAGLIVVNPPEGLLELNTKRG
jgi:16S rRNA processing protein RimM